MASALYPLGKEALLNASIDMDTDTIKVAAVSDTDYTYSSAHQYKSSVTSYSGSTDATLTSPTITQGVFDAADLSPAYSSLAQDAAKTIDALVIYKDTGVAGTSPLVAYIDLASSTTPNGGDINITWDSGASKIFAL